MELVQEGSLAGDNPSELSDDPLERLAAETPELDDGEDEQPAAVEPEPETKGRSQAREYVVLEVHTFEDSDEEYTMEVGRFTARNGNNALRKAFKANVTDDDEHRYIAVPASQWHVVPVRRSHRQVESVQIG